MSEIGESQDSEDQRDAQGAQRELGPISRRRNEHEIGEQYQCVEDFHSASEE